MGKVNIDFTPTKYNADDAPDLVTGAYNQSMDDLKTALDKATAEDSGTSIDVPVSIENGGTGANNAGDARANLGITLENIGAAAKTDLANYLPLTGGTVTGILSVKDSNHPPQLNVIDGSGNQSSIQTNNNNCSLFFVDPKEGGIQNRLYLYSNKTELRRPLTVESGGTGANTAEQARENLGIVDPTPVYVETKETSEPGLHIIVDSENNVLKIKKV